MGQSVGSVLSLCLKQAGQAAAEEALALAPAHIFVQASQTSATAYFVVPGWQQTLVIIFCKKQAASRQCCFSSSTVAPLVVLPTLLSSLHRIPDFCSGSTGSAMHSPPPEGSSRLVTGSHSRSHLYKQWQPSSIRESQRSAPSPVTCGSSHKGLFLEGAAT